MKQDGWPRSSSMKGRHPTYYKIKADIFSKVKSGPVNQAKYIKEAMKRFQCSQNSVRRPIWELLEEGKIISIPWFRSVKILKLGDYLN